MAAGVSAAAAVVARRLRGVVSPPRAAGVRVVGVRSAGSSFVDATLGVGVHIVGDAEARSVRDVAAGVAERAVVLDAWPLLGWCAVALVQARHRHGKVDGKASEECEEKAELRGTPGHGVAAVNRRAAVVVAGSHGLEDAAAGPREAAAADRAAEAGPAESHGVREQRFARSLNTVVKF